MPSAPVPTDIALSMPFFRSSETVTSPKYRWLCHDRGTESFVILQWTLSGEGVFDGSQGPQRVRLGHAFLAVLPEKSTYYYPPEAREPWTFSWFNFYGTFACDLFRRFQLRFGPVIPLAPRGLAAAALRISL